MKKIWKDTHPVDIYILAKEGKTIKDIAAALGVSEPQFHAWLRERPVVRYAVDKGKSTGPKEAAVKLQDYVYKRLPEHLQTVWDEICYWEEAGSGIEKIEAMMANEGLHARQSLWLHAMVSGSFNASDACKKVGVSMTTLKNWIANDPDFAELVDELQVHKKNFFESALIDLVTSRDAMAVIHANKTINRDRGYSEKIDVNVSGTVNHNVTVVSIDTLQLPIETREQILSALRAAKNVTPAFTVPNPLQAAISTTALQSRAGQ